MQFIHYIALIIFHYTRITLHALHYIYDIHHILKNDSKFISGNQLLRIYVYTKRLFSHITVDSMLRKSFQLYIIRPHMDANQQKIIYVLVYSNKLQTPYSGKNCIHPVERMTFCCSKACWMQCVTYNSDRPARQHFLLTCFNFRPDAVKKSLRCILFHFQDSSFIEIPGVPCDAVARLRGSPTFDFVGLRVGLRRLPFL